MALTRIYKYELYFGRTVYLPKGAKILSVGCQGDGLFLWAEVDPNETRKEARLFIVYGTGHDIESPEKVRKFVGTALMHGGSLVWHVFEKVETGGEA